MSNAGRSARKKAKELRWELSPIRRYGAVVVATIMTFAILIATHVNNTGLYIVFGIVAFIAFGIQYSKNDHEIMAKKAEIRRWQEGARTEKLTARQFSWRLACRRILLRETWYVFHDRQIPGSKSNIDHLLVGPYGVSVPDSKSRKRRWALADNQLLYDGHFVDVSTTAWEASEVRKRITHQFRGEQIPVRAFWALHSHTFPAYKFPIQNVMLTKSQRVIKILAKEQKVLSKGQIKSIAGYIDKTFPKV